METYIEMKQRFSRERAALPIIYTSKKMDLVTAMKLLKVNSLSEVIRIQGNGLIAEANFHLIDEICSKQETELESAIKADSTGEEFIVDMFDYELWKHDYCLSGDILPTLYELNLDEYDLERDSALNHGLNLAIKRQWEWNTSN